MAETRKKDPFQYDFDEQWDVERELYGPTLGKDNNRKVANDDLDVFLPTSRSRPARGEIPMEERKAYGTSEVQEEEHRNPPVVIPVEEPVRAGRPSGSVARASSATRMPPQPRNRSAVSAKKKKGKPNYKVGRSLGQWLLQRSLSFIF